MASDIFCRFKLDDARYYGRVVGKNIQILSAAPWLGGVTTGRTVRLRKVTFLPPSDPQTIIGLAGSYKTPADNPPRTVRWFAKSASAAATNGDRVEIPVSQDALKVEVELVIVIGKAVKNLSPGQAEAAIFGYTTGTGIFGFVDSYHRVNGEDRGRKEKILAMGLKLGDKFAPFGPFIHTAVDWRNRERKLEIITASGKVRASYSNNTNGLRRTPAEMVSDLSKVITLAPGDIIFSGTSKSFIIHGGETVRTEVAGLGMLNNVIVKS
ncbi:MAG: fumarylacetoacetate hydrolase family protein, partial [Emcibacter sp.]|nr:fumarylacetoacetate hydrolase family protein [Emcibacter sp.]